ncbi:stage III sporulation protein AC [Garciella nitratireducens]|uniref:Stage III sporulation protein AC n=1 Tax=Garciella nitratireducens DSM 15102 TaxID=1121911 RepID=A0A1T4K498_9FIRM|nr:stage III sporulation protein AC [Garciella nitratireducens]RBP46665.1 stage III sporulation protein AC [Garciella nitratireducens]SJZ37270.1 stage III sporulation protein AC [Garciella nitratireducens DSM 15102]
MADVNMIFKIAGIGIVVAVLNQVLKKTERDEMATMVTLTGIVVVLMMVIEMVGELFDSVRAIFQLY